MRKLIILFTLLIPFLANAMKIEKNEVDEFTGNRTIITSWESLCSRSVHIRFRLQNNHQYLDMKFMYDGAIVIGEDDKLMFKSTTDNISKFLSVSTYHGTKGGGAVGLMGSGNWGISASYLGDLSYFSDNITKLLRLYTTDGYLDKKVSESDGKKLVNLYNLFSTTLSGESGSVPVYANYTLTYLKSSNGGKSWEQVNEEYIKNASSEDIKKKMEQWKSQSSGSKLFECKVKKEK